MGHLKIDLQMGELYDDNLDIVKQVEQRPRCHSAAPVDLSSSDGTFG